MFHVGQLVVCVDDDGLPDIISGVSKGTVYTVRISRIGTNKGVRAPTISVEEIWLPLASTGFEWGYRASRFRPVQDSALDIFRKIEAPTPERESA